MKIRKILIIEHLKDLEDLENWRSWRYWKLNILKILKIEHLKVLKNWISWRSLRPWRSWMSECQRSWKSERFDTPWGLNGLNSGMVTKSVSQSVRMITIWDASKSKKIENKMHSLPMSSTVIILSKLEGYTMKYITQVEEKSQGQRVQPDTREASLRLEWYISLYNLTILIVLTVYINKL